MSHSTTPRVYRMSAPLLAVVLTCCTAVLTGCESEQTRLTKIYARANPAAGKSTAEGPAAGSAQLPPGRAAAAIALQQAWYGKKVTLDAALNLAHDQLDKSPDPNSVAFAGAVLDCVVNIEPDLKKAVINDFLWMRIGTLAGKAAAIAFKSDDINSARSLVLAGTESWQTENYWREHPSHDALASLVLHASGQSKQALDRLRDRAIENEETRAAMDTIEKAVRKARGG